MTIWEAFIEEQQVGRSDPVAEYRALSEGPALLDRNERGLLEATGVDRASWLHNLTTNEVKNLSPGEGNYAFALNLQGRILFDLNVLVRGDSLRLDIDRRFIDLAKRHFEKYTIVEDVIVADRSDEFVRLGLAGRGVKELLAGFGASHVTMMPWLAMAEINIGDLSVPVMRHDFCGSLGLELFVPADRAMEVWRRLSDKSAAHHAIPVGNEMVQVRRIEAGIPRPGSEITDEYLPAETKQLERAVSFRKGCYLGQEVVERMRSRGVVARVLVSLRFAGQAVPPLGATLADEDDKPVGVVTSSCRSMAQPGVIGLGYVKTASSHADMPLVASWSGGTVRATVVELPGQSAD